MKFRLTHKHKKSNLLILAIKILACRSEHLKINKVGLIICCLQFIDYTGQQIPIFLLLTYLFLPMFLLLTYLFLPIFLLLTYLFLPNLGSLNFNIEIIFLHITVGCIILTLEDDISQTRQELVYN